VRTEGRRVLVKLHPEQAVSVLEVTLSKGETVERQGALTALGEVSNPAADVLLSRWLDRLVAGQVPAGTQLDLLEAAGKRTAADIRAKLAKFEAARPKNDPLAKYRETLVGGDAERGRTIFYSKAEVQCLRCHKIKDEGGEVGPDLTGIGSRQKRDY